MPARVVVADPARPGLGGKAAARLAATGATRLILVSCDPASLGRDVAVLTGLGFAHAWLDPGRSLPAHAPRRGRDEVRSGRVIQPRRLVTYACRERRAAARRERCRARRRGRAVPTGRPRRGLPSSRRRGLRPRPSAARHTSRSPRRSRRRCSSGSGTTLTGSSRAAARCARISSRRRMAASVDLLRSEGARRRREEREARATAEGGYDLEHEVWDLATAERVRAAVSSLPDGERAGDRARVLRRAHLSRGGCTLARTRRHSEEPHPVRVSSGCDRRSSTSAQEGRHEPTVDTCRDGRAVGRLRARRRRCGRARADRASTWRRTHEHAPR